MVRNCPMISSAVYRLGAIPPPFAGRNLNSRSGLVYRGQVSERSRYESIWIFCSDEERLALFQLAKHRFLHSENLELRSLMRKGLIVRAPELRLMNESFRLFILETGEREEISALAQQGPASAWSMVSRPVAIGLLTIMIFLLSTQEQLRTVTMAFLTILPAFFATVPRLFAAAQTGKATTPSNG